MLSPLDAAVSCARRLDLAVSSTVMLRSTNNTVVRLEPAGVVVKVATAARSRLSTELTAARLLATAGAPVVGPSDLVAAAVYREAGLEMTFWPYVPQPESFAPDRAELASAMLRLHAALMAMTMPSGPAWPTLDGELAAVRHRLDDTRFGAALQSEDRRLLAGAIDFGREDLARRARGRKVLHGSPHQGNILAVEGRPHFIDLETVCVGPLEWDLAHLHPGMAVDYPGAVDVQALRTCRLLVSATTAAWCWDGIDRGPDMSFHAHLHLRAVRDQRGNSSGGSSNFIPSWDPSKPSRS